MITGELDGLLNGMWKVVHDSGELSVAATSYIFPNIKGDIDTEYHVLIRHVNGVAGTGQIRMFLNNDSNSANYGRQYMRGSDSAASAARATTGTGWGISDNAALGQIALLSVHLFTKSGKERTALAKVAQRISGTTVAIIEEYALTWSNTADEVFRISIGSQTGALGIGTRFILLKKTHAEGGVETGELFPANLPGVWERISEIELSTIETSKTKLLATFQGADGAESYTAETAQTVTLVNKAILESSESKIGKTSLSLKPVASTSIDGEDMADITDWSDSDAGTGASTQVTFDGKSCMKLDSGGTAGSGNYAFRIQDLGSFGARTVISANIYLDSIGTLASSDIFAMTWFNGTYKCYPKFCSDGLYFQTSGNVSTGVSVEQDVWIVWTFDINWTAKTVDVYKDGVLVVNDLDFSLGTSAAADGRSEFFCIGTTVANRIAYVDWFRAGETLVGGYATVPDSDDWYFGTGAFTLDAYCRWIDITGGQAILSQVVDGNNYWTLSKTSSHRIQLYYKLSSTVVATYYTDVIIEADVFYHIGVIRSGATVKIFVNGIEQSLTADVSITAATDFANLASPVYIGSAGTSSNFFNGWIDAARITKGKALWLEDFTLPTTYGCANAVVIGDLAGDTDQVYRLIVKGVSGTASAFSFRSLINNDSAANYGSQFVSGSNATVSASRSTVGQAIYIAGSSALGNLMYSDCLMYVKSGFARTFLAEFTYNITGTTVGALFAIGQVWNNTTDEVVVMSVYADVAAGLGVGTSVELYKLNL